MSEEKKKMITDMVNRFCKDYGYQNCDFPLSISASTLDDVLNGYINCDIYIEEIRSYAGHGDEGFLYFTYYNNTIKHTLLLREADDDYSFDSKDALIQWVIDLNEEVEKDKMEYTILPNPAETIAHAICEYINESGSLPYESDLTELIKDYLYT